jgi:hypothetical protein
MTVLEVALGLSLTTSLIWWAVDHLLKICRIEELEAELEECDNKVDGEIWEKWEV